MIRCENSQANVDSHFEDYDISSERPNKEVESATSLSLYFLLDLQLGNKLCSRAYISAELLNYSLREKVDMLHHIFRVSIRISKNSP